MGLTYRSASWWGCGSIGTLAGQAGQGATGPQEAALSCSIPLLEPTVASLCGQGRTILSPEAEPPAPSSSLLSPPGPGSSPAGWGCLLWPSLCPGITHMQDRVVAVP